MIEQKIAEIICTHPDYKGDCKKCNFIEPHISKCFMKGMIEAILTAHNAELDRLFKNMQPSPTDRCFKCQAYLKEQVR